VIEGTRRQGATICPRPHSMPQPRWRYSRHEREKERLFFEAMPLRCVADVAFRCRVTVPMEHAHRYRYVFDSCCDLRHEERGVSSNPCHRVARPAVSPGNALAAGRTYLLYSTGGGFSVSIDNSALITKTVQGTTAFLLHYSLFHQRRGRASRSTAARRRCSKSTPPGAGAARCVGARSCVCACARACVYARVFL
jgi:hypothetical protein